MRTTKLLSVSGLLLGALLFSGAGCMSTTKTTTNTNVVTTPSISILSPVDGATVPTHFDLTLAVNNFTLAPNKVAGANTAGEGHYHVWVDDKYFTPGVAATMTLKKLTAGTHTIYVTLQNNDHTDLATPVKSEPITITVK